MCWAGSRPNCDWVVSLAVAHAAASKPVGETLDAPEEHNLFPGRIVHTHGGRLSALIRGGLVFLNTLDCTRIGIKILGFVWHRLVNSCRKGAGCAGRVPAADTDGLAKGVPTLETTL